MRWTRTPPSKPGRYLCRFLESTGVGIEPFEIEVVEDTINGGNRPEGADNYGI